MLARGCVVTLGMEGMDLEPTKTGKGLSEMRLSLEYESMLDLGLGWGRGFRGRTIAMPRRARTVDTGSIGSTESNGEPGNRRGEVQR